MTEIQRIKKIIQWLIFSGYAVNESEIATILGYKKSSLSQILNEKVPLSNKFIDKLCALDRNINKDWIFGKSNQMLLQESSTNPEHLEQKKEQLYQEIIRSKEEIIEQLKETKEILSKHLYHLESKLQELQGKSIN